MIELNNAPEYWKNLNLNDIEGETWEVIEGYEGQYYVSDFGRIKSLIQKNRPKILKQGVCCGYLRVDLIKKTNHKLVHILVAKAFVTNPGNKPQVNHKFGETKDNRATQLEWMTYSEQQIHAQKVLGFMPNISGLLKKIEKSKRPIKQIDAGTNSVVRVFNSQQEACREFGLDKDAIYRVLKLRQPTAAGYKWGYV